MKPGLEAFLRQPPHAVLVAGAMAAEEAASFAAELLAGDSTYLRTIAPEGRATTTIEQIRELITFFQLKVPGRARLKRAAVIEQAETMTHEAQNALLKLLEEPPADSVLVLASARPQRLLATIRSRVQTVYLSEEPLIPETEAVQLVKQVLAGTTYDRLLLIDGPLKDKEVASRFVATLATVASASLTATAQKGNGTRRWQKILGAAYTAQEALERSGNPKLVLTDLILAI